MSRQGTWTGNLETIKTISQEVHRSEYATAITMPRGRPVITISSVWIDDIALFVEVKDW